MVQKPCVFFTPSGELLKSKTLSTSTGSAVRQNVECYDQSVCHFHNFIAEQTLLASVALQHQTKTIFVQLFPFVYLIKLKAIILLANGWMRNDEKSTATISL